MSLIRWEPFGSVEDVFAMRGIQEYRVRELLGHTPVEVLVGAALGVGVGLLPF